MEIFLGVGTTFIVPLKTKHKENMREWVKITLCVSLFASFRDFRPVDSFYTSYLTSPAVNFTTEQVSVFDYTIR